MDAKIKKIQITPATVNDDGDITKVETATLTLDIPLDTKSAKKEVIALFEVLTQEYVTIAVENTQLPLSNDE